MLQLLLQRFKNITPKLRKQVYWDPGNPLPKYALKTRKVVYAINYQ
jgi:hypothetical protein